MTRSGLADLMATIATELHEQPDEEITTQAIVDRALSVIDDADHVSVTVRDKKEHRTLATTSRRAEDVDHQQYDLGEGPCIDSADQGEWYRSGDVGQDPRWPTWGPSAARNGIGSLLSIRLLSEGSPFGALNMYADSTGRFADPDQVELALLFTVHAANALANARQVAHLETAMTSRHDVGVAQGIVMARYGITANQAFAVLRRMSQHGNVKLREIAREVARTGSLPLQDETPR